MTAFTFRGHGQASGLKALLELFCGPAEVSSVLLHGETLPLFTADDGRAALFLSEQDENHTSLYLCEDDGGTWRETRLLERIPLSEDPSRQVKRQFYRGLRELTGISWPWGSLTGIRPTYIAAELLRARPEAEALRFLTEGYGLAPEKAELAVLTAKQEEKLLSEVPEHSYAAYIGVPFCPTRCSYCSFTTAEGIATAERFGAAYLERLEEEIRDFLRYEKALGAGLRALYIGGGTPAALDEPSFAKLLDLALSLPLEPDAEITVEAGRSDVISRAKLEAMASRGIRRICLNPQSLNEETLRKVGRKGSIAELKAVYDEAKKLGISVINLDLIAGLDEDPSELLSHVRTLLSWNPESVTLHTLALKRGSDTDIRRREANREARIRPEPRLEAILSEAQSLLREAGLMPYYLYRQHYGRAGLENVAFARPGCECVYNIMMMSDRYPVVSFGTPAMSKAFAEGRLRRLASPKSLRAYLEGDEIYLEKKEALLTAL